MKLVHDVRGRGEGGRESGFALADTVVAMLLLTVAVGGLVGSVMWGLKLHRSNGEAAVAAHAARRTLAELRTVPFDQLFATWSAAPDVFVDGLNVRADDADGQVAQLVFPAVAGAGGLELREDVDMPALGMPRDLNGDGVIDALNHADDYLILPVTLRLEWRGAAGNARQDYHTVLTR